MHGDLTRELLWARFKSLAQCQLGRYHSYHLDYSFKTKPLFVAVDCDRKKYHLEYFMREARPISIERYMHDYGP